ncbi:GNAT family N-acetyltransferase [Streptomyces sp. NPDC086783]|uniref:GNAT family N-acetyltransferase n=1 Tax=Streptomyces sp. NPDC086783 TaxID=3365758 RepID=UPI003830373C
MYHPNRIEKGLIAMIPTPRLLLRPFRSEDATVLSEYRSDELVARYQGWSPPVSIEQAQNLVDQFMRASPNTPGWFQYAIELQSEGRIIGDLGVRSEQTCEQAELGLTICRAYHGYGFATEVLEYITRELFDIRKMHRVYATCDARNLPAAAALKSSGFRLDGRLRSATFIKGEWTDDLVFSQLAEDRHR